MTSVGCIAGGAPAAESSFQFTKQQPAPRARVPNSTATHVVGPHSNLLHRARRWNSAPEACLLSGLRWAPKSGTENRSEASVQSLRSVSASRPRGFLVVYYDARTIGVQISPTSLEKTVRIKPAVGPDPSRPSLNLDRHSRPVFSTHELCIRRKKVPPQHPASTRRERHPRGPGPFHVL